MATLTGYINRYIRSYEMLRQPYVLDWEDGDYSDRNYEVESMDFEVEVPEGYTLKETTAGDMRLFAPDQSAGGLTLADAIVRGVAKAPKHIYSSDGREFVATQLAHGQQGG